MLAKPMNRAPSDGEVWTGATVPGWERVGMGPIKPV
jgi:hypothetical protein